jgi:hypothetical protein
MTETSGTPQVLQICCRGNKWASRGHQQVAVMYARPRAKLRRWLSLNSAAGMSMRELTRGMIERAGRAFVVVRAYNDRRLNTSA